ncbi:hypothetical protein PV325_010416, partial [Microctonus aethiopoides]
MDVSVCCLQPSAGSGVQHPSSTNSATVSASSSTSSCITAAHHLHHHNNTNHNHQHNNNHHHHHHNHHQNHHHNNTNHHPSALPSGGQQLISSPYQYADQIVPDRGQPDGLTLVNSGQDAWQSNSAGGNAGIATATTAYIDYSWLQMQEKSGMEESSFERAIYQKRHRYDILKISSSK